MAESNNLRVNCYCGHTYAERPESFVWRGVAYEIAATEKAWLEPQQRCFLVLTKDNKLFRLCYNEMSQQWSLVEAKEGVNPPL